MFDEDDNVALCWLGEGATEGATQQQSVIRDWISIHSRPPPCSLQLSIDVICCRWPRQGPLSSLWTSELLLFDSMREWSFYKMVNAQFCRKCNNLFFSIQQFFLYKCVLKLCFMWSYYFEQYFAAFYDYAQLFFPLTNGILFPIRAQRNRSGLLLI